MAEVLGIKGTLGASMNLLALCCPAVPTDVTPSPGLVTESRRIKCFCTSLCEFEKKR